MSRVETFEYSDTIALMEVILFYKYASISDPEAFMKAQRKLCESLGLKGRILIAKEGINGTLEGEKAKVEKYCEALLAMAGFEDVHFKRSVGTGNSFPKLIIKVRDEIVTSGFGTLENTDGRVTGEYLKPEELKEWIKSGKEFYIVDMRNDYEQKSGHFAGSILSGIQNFKDLPQFLPKIAHLKEKEVLTVCTGGVRCEKASGFLMENGFSNVYQLEGGMHSYMEKYPNEDFKGKLYVFDNRILVGFNTDSPKHEVIGLCDICGVKSENYVNCANNSCHKHYIVCNECNDRLAGCCTLQCRILNIPVIRFGIRLMSKVGLL